MSYNRPPADSQNSSGSTRVQDWEGGHRERSTSRGFYSEEGGATRERQHSISRERDHRSLGLSSTASGSDRGRALYGRWPQDTRQRGNGETTATSVVERTRRERKYSNTSRHSSRETGSHQSQPPPPSSRQTSSVFVRNRMPVPPFYRRATEPGEVLEEGELEMEDRGGSNRTLGSRSYTGAHVMRNRQRCSSEVQPLMSRSDRCSPMPSMQHTHASHYPVATRPGERKASYSSHRSDGSRHVSRAPTPASPTWSYPTRATESPQILSSVRMPGRSSSLSMSAADKINGSVQGLGAHIRTATRSNDPAFAISTGSQAKAEMRDGDRTPSPKAEPEVAVEDVDVELELSRSQGVPKQKKQLENRISDIDREIAECKEKLVQISGTGVFVEPAAEASVGSTLPETVGEVKASDDRAVPRSPPLKQKTEAKLTASHDKSGEEINKAAIVYQVESATEDTAADMAGPIVPQTTDSAHGDEGIGAMEVDVIGASAAENETGNVRKDKVLELVDTIYAENQMRAAAMEARMAEGFLAAFPTFVPGSYPSPTDWPFWEENERIHARIRPHLAKILWRERRQNQSYARRLQEEYSTLYTKWRKRVDKLDRQREAKQRNMASKQTGGGSGSSSSAASGGTSVQAAFGATMHRRRNAGSSAAGAPLTDEFGFGLGPLFAKSGRQASIAESGAELFTSDAVHSEAELQAIIERLQHDDARNPDLRSQRTAATIPDMVVAPKQRAQLQFDNNSHAVADPISFYHVAAPEPGTAAYRRSAYGNNGDTDHYWTQAEVSAFVTAYLTYPKQFGRIAAHVPHKSMNECVLFYYRNKKPLRLKELEAKSSRRARRSRQASGGGRRRRERARERREKRTREERERMAVAAVAECAAAESAADEGTAAASAPGSDDDGSQAAAAYAVLEQRTKSNALLRSIIAATRQRKREAVRGGASALGLDDNVTGIDDMPALVSPVTDAAGLDDEDDVGSVDDLVSPAPEGVVESAPSSVVAVSVPVSAVTTHAQRDERSDEEEGELVDDGHWEPARRRRTTHELGAYALGGSIVRTRRSRGAETEPEATDSDSDDDEEIVEASGVVTGAGRPRIVSRRSQSRFGAMLTSVLEPCASDARRSDCDCDESGAVLHESAQDRFVAAEHVPALRRPLSSHETLLMMGAAEPGAGLGSPRSALELRVEIQCGTQDSVLVGAAAWLREDRRRVLRAFHRFGTDFAQVASLMPSKSPAQCRYFYYHYRTPAGDLLSETLDGVPPEPSRELPRVALELPAAAAPAAVDALPPAALVADPGVYDNSAPSEKPVPSGRASPDASGDDDDDDEMPLATQLASELAALEPTPAPRKNACSSYWSVHERAAFLHFISRVGPSWPGLAAALGTKTATQVRNYFRANREKLELDAAVAEYERNYAAGTLPPVTPFSPQQQQQQPRDDTRRERRGRKRKSEAVESPGSTPNTAPASLTSFPTMGVDGGRAVVFTRPPQPPKTLPVVAVRSAMREASIGSSTPASQPTPSPVRGLPRLSSSPSASRPSALRISSLTSAAADEPRKASVTAINALLNDEPADAGPPSISSDWFGLPAHTEDEATGIAALALASMMGATEQQSQRPVVVAHPQPRAYPSRPPLASHPPDSLPPIVAIHSTSGAASAFSPVVHRSPVVRQLPLSQSPPPQPYFRSHSRPSSADPAMAYPRPVAKSPSRFAFTSGAHALMRQRKPSAPPLPHPPTSVGISPRVSAFQQHALPPMPTTMGPADGSYVRTGNTLSLAANIAPRHAHHHPGHHPHVSSPSQRQQMDVEGVGIFTA
ncbi:DNA-binding protein snt1 [Coemansia sp. RSA 1365]|nr:DNA-binding protein snt1 [Coemansia sp. RSA 1365]